MTSIRTRAALGAALLLSLVSACGGGGGGASAPPLPSIALSFEPASVVVSTTQGLSREVAVAVTATGDAAGPFYVVIEDPAQILGGVPAITQYDAQHYEVQLTTSDRLAPGHYTGAFRIHLCRDAGCSAQYGGSPYDLPYDVTVEAVSLRALLPFEDASGLKLLDPRQPASATNPLAVDATGWQASNGVTLLGADWNGAQLSDVWTVAQVYVKSGMLYRVNLAVDASHAPVQVSSLDTACAVRRVYQDYQDADQAWLLVWVRDAEGTCTAPETLRMVRAGASGATPGVVAAIASSNQLQAVHAANGAIAGFLSFETPYVVRRNADFADPVNVLHAYDPGTTDYHGLSYANGDFTERLYFVSRGAGDAMPTVYRYQVGTGVLTPIAAWGLSGVPIFPIGAVDAHNYYWGSGGYTGALYRVGHASTTPVRMSAPLADELRYPRVTTSRVVVERVRNGSSSGIYALPKDAVEATPSVVVDPDNGGFTSVYNAHPNGTLLITNIQASFSWTYTSYVARDDGTILQTLEGRQWKIRVLDGVWNPVGHSVARYVAEAASSFLYAPPRAVYDTATGEKLADLPGITDNDYPAYGAIGFGRYATFDARIRKASSSWDWDAYLIDTIGGVQSPVMPDPDTPQHAVLSDWNL